MQQRQAGRAAAGGGYRGGKDPRQCLGEDVTQPCTAAGQGGEGEGRGGTGGSQTPSHSSTAYTVPMQIATHRGTQRLRWSLGMAYVEHVADVNGRRRE